MWDLLSTMQVGWEGRNIVIYVTYWNRTRDVGRGDGKGARHRRPLTNGAAYYRLIYTTKEKALIHWYLLSF